MSLLSPRTRESRPITDRVKESLFNVLASYDLVADARVADLFCGVGSLGLEALSRGAAFVTFVETSADVITVLQANIARAGFADRSQVVRASAFGVGAPAGSGPEKHDLVFVDPPYAFTGESGDGSPLAQLLELLGGQVVERGVVVLRTRRGVTLLDRYGAFQAVDRRQWGTMSIVLLQARTDEQQASGD